MLKIGMGITWLQTALLGSERNTIGKASCKSCDEKSHAEEISRNDNFKYSMVDCEYI